MIDTPHLTIAQLADAWQHICAASPADKADPLVLDCAHRLASDPGGEHAHVWVSGLVTMSGYLAWRPGQTAERAALDALHAAAKALADRPCSHDSHPYEAEMDALEDEVWAGDNGLLTGELASPDGDTDTGRILCPVNVAGWARLAADVIAPFSVRRIPAGAPRYHHSCIRTLSGIVNDYPYCDPHDVLTDEAACLPPQPTRGVLAGYLVTMNATCWYAASERIMDPAVPAAMVKGVRAAVTLLSDHPCTHGPGEHPDTNDPDHLNRVGYLLRSPGGRAEFAEDYGWDDEDEDEYEEEPLDAWVCPAFLHDLADETLDALKVG
ncbi:MULTISPECIES: hypothetical protein [unclassified Streptomyces]|uniref:hypothetical protein n=1 Tax=unclassified Streptomyces TaxID=2593676 RepID=UPI00088BD0F8|nr:MULTISPECIES: hypothetical protein [unclassified Streptomyces]PBC80303.1 hypothetical protein BX261_0122 [Streptomyces sp. 2321.6]SDR59316.1 hypothetical protein SAMN05216511_7103 [Streptomyces sp. KS_16]SEB69626.1 hypothetical protein SAMN05428940_0122 [Streptomyces sp. 2133.1]SNC59748.1 hypothetical protein SAMN06272741_0123 [Streptomyces sp. 2114.4]